MTEATASMPNRIGLSRGGVSYWNLNFATGRPATSPISTPCTLCERYMRFTKTVMAASRTLVSSSPKSCGRRSTASRGDPTSASRSPAAISMPLDDLYADLPARRSRSSSRRWSTDGSFFSSRIFAAASATDPCSGRRRRLRRSRSDLTSSEMGAKSPCHETGPDCITWAGRLGSCLSRLAIASLRRATWLRASTALVMVAGESFACACTSSATSPSGDVFPNRASTAR